MSDTWDDDMPAPSEDPRNPCPKCDSVSMAPADGSGRLCPKCGWSWLIGELGGRYMDVGKPDTPVAGSAPPKVVIYCADVGSIPRKKFGWARVEQSDARAERYRGGRQIEELVNAVTTDLRGGASVALGFEAPLTVPVPEAAEKLGGSRPGDGDRSWSAAAGAAALATGIVQTAWVLRKVFRACGPTHISFTWEEFRGQGGLLLWEAFVTKQQAVSGDSDCHMRDALTAARWFRGSLLDLTERAAPEMPSSLSLIVSAALWSGLTSDVSLLHSRCLVLRVPDDACEAPHVGSRAPSA